MDGLQREMQESGTGRPSEEGCVWCSLGISEHEEEMGQDVLLDIILMQKYHPVHHRPSSSNGPPVNILPALQLILIQPSWVFLHWSFYK